MAIAEMQKLNLVAMAYDRDKILNVLQSTGATEVKYHAETESTRPLVADCDALSEYSARTEAALGILCAEVDSYNKEHKTKSNALEDGIPVTLSEFRKAGEFKAQADALVDKINALAEKRRELTTEQSRLARTLEQAKIYAYVQAPLSMFVPTRHAVIRLGLIPVSVLAQFEADIREHELYAYEVICSDEESALVAFAAHRSQEQAETFPENYNFTPCPFKDECSGEEVYKSLLKRKEEIASLLSGIQSELYSLGGGIKPLKIYCDYLAFELEKLTLTEKMRCTERTFLLEAYVPKEAEGAVKAALEGATGAVYYEFTQPSIDELPPTLYKNNAVVKNFEAITDMYSSPNSREFDPNAIMWLFYSIFLGFIMADIGYGFLMLLGGGILYLKKRQTESTIKRLSGVFAIGGIFTIAWGVLFGSFFGVEILKPVMPNAQNDMWGFMGIKVPAVLVICLEIGVLQLFTGYICRTVQAMRRGHIADGILDGVVWAVFSVGVGLAIVGLLDEVNISYLAMVGGIMAGAALVVAIFTAGRKEKLLGKFTKGFGAAYSVINYASDILSYARLYGLMLSGAVIAQIISQYAITGTETTVGFIVSGNAGLVVLGVVLVLIGHAFNLAIGLLGAYIHDARLQYVEFYGRFFEGEGELFAPLGSSHKFVKVINR